MKSSPSHRSVSTTLLVICTLVFLWQLSLAPADSWRLVYNLGVIPAVLFHSAPLPVEPILPLPPALTLITSQFLHGSWVHLIGNLLYLWIFGDAVEEAMGTVRFLAFYLLCGSTAVLAQALCNPALTIPMIGASGAIAGVLGAYLLLHPWARIHVLIPLGAFSRVMYLPASGVIGFWLLLQLLGAILADSRQSSIGWLAHLGGFVTGMVLLPVCKFRQVRLFSRSRHYS